MEEKQQIKQRIMELWRDERSWKERLLLSALAAFMAAFTFVTFGPIELYVENEKQFAFSFWPVAGLMGLLGLAAFGALLGILMLLRGKVWNTAASLLFALTVAGYLQCNLFNLDHGVLDGSGINWIEFKWPMAADLLAWCAIIAVVFLLLYLSRSAWAGMVKVGCAIVIVAQLAALVSLTVTGAGIKGKQDFLSKEGLFELSGHENVVVFVLDNLDVDYMDPLLEEHPEWYEKLSDFQYYHDYTGSTIGTFPSLPHLLTGFRYDYSMPSQDFFDKIWKETTLLPDIHAAGCTIHLYTDEYNALGSRASRCGGMVDNIASGTVRIDYKELAEKMLVLSAYRYLPEACKPFFHIYTDDLTGVAVVENASAQQFRINDVSFWNEFAGGGLTFTEDEKDFVFYHLNGAHPPYTRDAEGSAIASTMDDAARDPQVAGEMDMIFRYIDALKAGGVYEDTAIVLIADHGRYTGINQLEEMDAPRLPILMIKAPGPSTGKPMTVSTKQVAMENLHASLVSWCGGDPTPYGDTIEQLGENETRTRQFWLPASDAATSTRDVELIIYEIVGDAHDMKSWRKVSSTPIQYPYWLKGM